MNILIPIYTYTKDEIKNFPSWVNGGAMGVINNDTTRTFILFLFFHNLSFKRNFNMFI